MKKILFLILLFFSVTNQIKPQIGLSADYNKKKSVIEITLKNTSDSLTYIFWGTEWSQPSTSISVINDDDGKIYCDKLCGSGFFPGVLYLFYPGEQIQYTYHTFCNIRGFDIHLSYHKAKLPREEWGIHHKDSKINSELFRKYKLKGICVLDYHEAIK